MVALFRLVELNPSTPNSSGGGCIRIDGVDTSTLGLDFLREAMTIVAQDSVLFAGTIRSNLDPFQDATDAAVWQVLERTHLAAFVRSLPLQLNDPVSDNGENLSQGQRCCVCLARAMLRPAKILIMDGQCSQPAHTGRGQQRKRDHTPSPKARRFNPFPLFLSLSRSRPCALLVWLLLLLFFLFFFVFSPEATASIDMATDALIQQSLRSDFSDRTLLTIAHRLHTIIDYDRVLVMAGQEIAKQKNSELE